MRRSEYGIVSRPRYDPSSKSFNGDMARAASKKVAIVRCASAGGGGQVGTPGPAVTQATPVAATPAQTTTKVAKRVAGALSNVNPALAIYLPGHGRSPAGPEIPVFRAVPEESEGIIACSSTSVGCPLADLRRVAKTCEYGRSSALGFQEGRVHPAVSSVGRGDLPVTRPVLLSQVRDVEVVG